MRRLYVQIYLAFVAVGLASLIVSGAVAALIYDGPEMSPIDAAVVVAAAAASPQDDLQGRLQEAHTEHGVSITVWDDDGQVLASVGERLPRGRNGWFRRPGVRGVRFALEQGRTLAAGYPVPPGRRLSGLAWLAALASVVAVGCYPIARRITRRLEVVGQGVERWGEGDLAARVPVEGRDEVASVAQSFNAAAERVEQLFEAQRRVLASASHELRSPLARLRMAIELVDEGLPQEGWARGAIRDVEELDATVGDLLSVGRMQALDGPSNPESVDLNALLAEEAAHVGGSVFGPARSVEGDPRLLRRLARNLLENAARHGEPPIEVEVHDDGFSVLDRGPGVAGDLQQRIFEPFYRPPGHHEGRDGGVGLGLHLVREIALHHGGDVFVEERQGGGARFRVRLAGMA